ncbi:MAG: gliding motility-associated C-terminal domain-containing protein [Saprospiraceae bacterium]|uniref:Gliding motility-associated C-terminal domain-containing protein n=1 Tax=Candidatus Opimibacter skivensis TaxID=2982028 RepID=A0A9D7XQG8_9BACT|nr:gliding motility-associated C-terminal domain-containing protein [Candidatus Opimibacter skivensis]
MVSPDTQFFRKGFLLFSILFSLLKLNAQCNPPGELPTVDCASAPLTCLADACYSTLNIPAVCCMNFCGLNTIINNPQYFQFIATATNIEIDIHVDNCSSGQGLQSAIVTSCAWQPCPGGAVPCPDILACNPGTSPGGTMVLIAGGLTIGQTYWLLIDGSNGSTCQYTIEYVTGVFEPQIDEDITMGEAIPPVVCQGFDDFMMTCAPSIPNAHGYLWHLEWNNTFVTSTLTSLTMDIDNNAPVGIWDICVQAFSGCDTSDVPFCFPVEIVAVDDIEKDPASYCPEEFPFFWHGISIGGPGTYMKTFNNPDGCPYDTIWEVEQYPDVPIGELDTLFCMNSNFDPFFYENETYDNAGTYDLFYPGMGLNGCDSMAHLNLVLGGIDAFIELTCENGQFILTPLIQELVPANANITWEWISGGATIFDDKILEVLDGGCYECYATVETPLGDCTYLIGGAAFCFDANQYWPPAPNLGFTDTLVCAQQGVFITVIEDPNGEPNLEYVWTGPADAPLFQDGSNVAEFDFTNSAGGTVCVYAIGACGDGSSTCVNVDIQTSPVAAFTYDATICNDSTSLITFTGTAGPTAQYVWDFDNPSSVTGSGAGPYSVSWNIDGTKTISLQVIQPGCDTSIISHDVIVSNLLTPIVNCSSTINSITFDWDDVVGASAYTVSINNGAPIGTVSSVYTVNMLNPNDMVTLTLTVLSNGPCDDIVVTTTCTAQNCPPPTIVVSGIDSACLNAPSIISLSALVNGNPGVGVWAGPGIIDTALGLFNPIISGSGQHQVTFTTDVNGCSFSEPFLITVFDSLTADFTVDPLICITDNATVTYTGNASPGATYAYDFGAATIVSGAGQGPYELSYATPGSKTIRLQITDNGCTSDLISQNLTVGAALNLPVVNCMSNTSGVSFCWTPDPLVSNYVVNALTPQIGVVTGNCIDFGGLVPGDSVAIEIISQTAGPCPQRIDTFSCIARACPTPMITVKPQSDICLYTGTTPINLQVTVVGGNGVGDWSGTGITDVVNGKFDPVLAGAGSHVITYHYLDDGCDFIKSITINVYDPPQAVISNPSFVLTCAGGNVLLLDGSASSGGAILYQWTTATGVINSGATTSMAQVGKEGVYQLKVTHSLSGCADSVSVTVTKDANTPNADAGLDRVLTCDSVTFVLGGGSSTGTNITYNWTTVGGHIVGPTDGVSIIVDEVGQYDIIVKDTSNGCQSTDRAFVTIDTALTSLVLTPGDTIDCNTTISGVQSTLGAPIVEYDFFWTTADGLIVGSNTGPDIDVSQGGTYVLKIHNKDNGCEKTASAVVPESNLIINDIDVSLMNITCFGDDNGALVINGVIGGIGPYTYQWSVSPQGGTSLSSLSPGQYSLTVTDQNGCSFTKIFNLNEPIQITVDLGADQIVAGGDSVKIDLITNITPNAINDIEWGGYDGLTCPGCPKLEFIASSSGNVTAIVTDTAGCTASDSMHLKVIVPRIIFIPTVFSPNGDGINDVFFISGRRNLIGIGYLRIYDRWGNLLFNKIGGMPGNESDGWDGKFNGQPLLPGVYVYTAELQYEDLTETVKGGITIIR